MIEFGLIFLILFAPLAFGSVYVWAFSIMEIIVFSMMIALVVRKWVQGEKISFPLFFPVIAFLSLIFFQMIPLPPPAIKFMSPKTHKLYCQTLDGYSGENKRSPVKLGFTQEIAFQDERPPIGDQDKEGTKQRVFLETGGRSLFILMLLGRNY